jgi:hypothetical protein
MTARSHRKPGISPSGPRSKKRNRWGYDPQKGSPAKRPGESLRVAPQYIQKTPKNNGLFDIWLAEFGANPGFCEPQNRHVRDRANAKTISASPTTARK